jgi:hypothetical protein
MEADRHRDSYFFGGYLVTQRVARPEPMSAELLPAQLLTASACIASFVPDIWSLDWTNITDEGRQAAGAALGLAPAMLPALMSHVTTGFNEGKFGWPNVVKSTDALADLMSLLPRSREWVALGLALHRRYAAAFLEENAPPEGQGAGGVYELLVNRPSLPTGGIILGFEPLGFEHGGQPHSWLCNQLEKECSQALGIRPNSIGFLQTEDEAERVTAHISRDDVGAEPVQWLPWMILDYTAELSKPWK